MAIDEDAEEVDGDETMDDTENEEAVPGNWQDPDSWITFAQSLLVYFIITMLFGLFGSSFIYLSSRGRELDNIFPTDDLFYGAQTYQVNKSNASNIVDCNETSNGSFLSFENNFPYNLIHKPGTTLTKEDIKKLSLVESLCNWFGRTTAGCFKSNRGLIKGWLDFFRPDSFFGNHILQIYIAAPLTICLSWVALITGFWTAFGAGVGSNLKLTVWGGFFLFSWGLFGGLAGIIFLRLLATLFFLPISQNWKEVANIMACNVKALVILFGFFVCGAAYDTLDPMIAGVMGIVYIALVAFSIWKYFTKNFV